MKIQTTLFSAILIHALIIGCSSNTETIIESKEVSIGSDKKVGRDLFAALLDTIQADELSIPKLTQSNWTYKPFPNCISTLTFHKDGVGIEYNCEIEEGYTFNYLVKQDTLHVTEFHVPHVDNPEGKSLRLRNDMYVLNNNSLTLVGSKMYNNAQIPYDPHIEVVIQYSRNKYN